MNIWIPLLIIAGLLGALLTATAGLTWFERRLLAGFQDRLGPNRVGPMGIFQPVADGIKLLMKEDWIPPFANRMIFVLAPGLLLLTALLAFAVIPFTEHIKVADVNIGLLFFIAMTSLSVYSVVLAGWASNSKYALLGAMRGAAQMISYELPMLISLVGIVMLAGSLRLSDIVHAQAGVWFAVQQPIGFIIFMISGMAEARRVPFDIPEADSELVAGYHTEYSGMKFAMFYMGEYLELILISAMVTTLFLGGWYGPWIPGIIWFGLKTVVVISFCIAVRAVLPRYRFDQLMNIGWKALLPLSLLNILITGAVVLMFGH